MTDSAHAPIAPSAADVRAEPRIKPFWRRLNDFFLFPFQAEPLLWMVGLTVLGTVAALLPLVGLLVGLLVSLATVYYFFKIAALAARGVLKSKDYANNMMESGWIWLPIKLFVVLFVYGVVVGFLIVVFHSPLIALLLLVILLLTLPSTVMVMIRSERMLPALNPAELMAAVTDVGVGQYLLLCLFLFLLLICTVIAMQYLPPIVPKMLLVPAGNFVELYFTWVMAALIGYVMYQHHGALQIDTLKEPEEDDSDTESGSAGIANLRAARRITPEDQEARRRDTQIADLVQQGDMREAIAQAREWVRVAPTSVPDHRRYHRVLLLDDASSGRLATHAPQYITLLLSRKQHAEALRTLQETQHKLPDFALTESPIVLALGEQAWSTLDARTTLQVLRGFDKRFPKAQEIPKAYELIVRALKQGMGRGDKALPVAQAMLKRFPDHPSTKEVQWVLRDELQQAGAPAAPAAPPNSAPPGSAPPGAP